MYKHNDIRNINELFYGDPNSFYDIKINWYNKHISSEIFYQNWVIITTDVDVCQSKVLKK